MESNQNVLKTKEGQQEKAEKKKKRPTEVTRSTPTACSPGFSLYLFIFPGSLKGLMCKRYENLFSCPLPPPLPYKPFFPET